ncbi:protein tyrosine phosphatase, partial [Pseudoxanthomonas sp. SGD-10]
MDFFKKFFTKKEFDIKDSLAWLGADMHNHILFGIDDGSRDLAQSLELLKGMTELGFRKVICTPHVMEGVYNNTPVHIAAVYEQLLAAVRNENLNIELEFAAEYMIDEGIATWIESDQLCLLPHKHVLIEMSYLSESKSLFSIIKRLRDKGYQPILAHPERYNYYHSNFKIFQEIKKAGCYLQLNLLSVSRYYGESVKAMALTLIKAGLYDFVGTDMHHERHLSAIKEV